MYTVTITSNKFLNSAQPVPGITELNVLMETRVSLAVSLA